jgi:hypothetical protein
VPNQKLFLLNITGHAQGQPYLITLRKGFEPFGQFRALLPVILLGEGLSPKAWSRLIERKARLMNAGLSMKPQKAQVKDKALGAEFWDFGLQAPRFPGASPKT